ncbi:thiamine pyrophosphate-binding protein [Cumulibacter manganitolerans]|uniref:thiamine pyrophosphate-binding protein n=1 Tax=Cumulibacter manganitolerans TaxID=1884992 RepID=UPI0012962C6E|nr:thiamine pyrophosphate-binding protein [Cumulibacter manganitolerans]
MELHELVADFLGAQGSPVFGLMGDANMLYLATYQDKGHRYLPVSFEGSSVGAADAYFRLTGRAGLASVTHGPALTNTMTSLVEAVRARSSLVLLTGEVPLESTHFQRVDIAAVAAAAGAGFETIYRPATALRDMTRAMQRAVAERRPVILDVPFAMLRVTVPDPARIPLAVKATPARPDDDQLEAAVGAIVAARRPVVLAGRGAVDAGARDALIALADRLGAPLATTLQAKGYFRGHLRNVGIHGTLSHSVASGAIGEADCIIAFGASLNVYTTDGGALTKDTTVVHVDEDPGRFGRFTHVDAPVVADARLAAEAMLALLVEADHTGGQQWGEQIAAQVAAWKPEDEFQDRSGTDTIDPRTAIVRLNRLLPEDRVVVNDIGRFVVAAWPYLEVPEPQDFVNMGAFGSIGLGLGATMGAIGAHPDRLIVTVVGDGGFMMNPTELASAVRQRAKLLLVIMNDGAYGAEYYKLEDYGVNPDYSLNHYPDLAGVCEALGARVARVQSVDDLEKVAALLDEEGPIAVDIRLDPAMNTAH